MGCLLTLPNTDNLIFLSVPSLHPHGLVAVVGQGEANPSTGPHRSSLWDQPELRLSAPGHPTAPQPCAAAPCLPALPVSVQFSTSPAPRPARQACSRSPEMSSSRGSVRHTFRLNHLHESATASPNPNQCPLPCPDMPSLVSCQSMFPGGNLVDDIEATSVKIQNGHTLYPSKFASGSRSF